MFRHVLVPLDGSQLAEAALPVASAIASRLGAGVTLIHVIERHAPETIHRDRHLRNVDEATSYLSEMALRAFPRGLRVDTHVHTAEVTDVARSIVDHADELEPDLVVMCTHGRSGPRGLVFGTIAQQVIALGTIPVLLIQPEVEVCTPDLLRSTILVPLDQNPDHACSLPFALGLAKAFEARLELLSVIPTFDKLAGHEAATGRLLPGATRLMLDLDEEQARAYLDAQASTMRAEKIEVRTSVTRGEPAAAIVEAAGRMGAALILMGAHGTLGSEAFWERSVPPKVSARTPVPVLFIPTRCR
jgi:nucleotide-binding universal stress UspA family protein